MRHFIILSACVFLVSCQAQIEIPPDQQIVEKMATASTDPKGQFNLGQLQIRTADDSAMSSLLTQFGTDSDFKLTMLNRIPNRSDFLVEVEGSKTLDDVITVLKKDSRVVGVSKNYRINADRGHEIRTSDPLFHKQWALENIGQEAPSALAGVRGADIGMAGVTAEGSHQVVVAVIDTGIDYFHEDLAITEVVDGRRKVMLGSNIWINPYEIPGNGLNDDNNGASGHGAGYIDDVHGYNFVSRTGNPMDDQGHGTHVAGVIGALRDNHIGIMGINSKVSLMGLKFLDHRGGGTDFDARAAIYYLIDLKKRFPDHRFITSNSWGSSSRSSENGDEDDLLLWAFAEASAHGILNVAAAGNNGLSNRFNGSYPANYASKIPSFMTVAATSNMDQLATFSSYGFDVVQVAAPGVLIMSTVPEAAQGVRYAAWSGTSMATPHVSGLAALVWSQNMNFTAEEVKKRIERTVDILPQLQGVVSSGGRINIRRALEGDLNPDVSKFYEEIPYVIQSPQGDDSGTFDTIVSKTVEGAKEIAVCFSRINLSSGFDWLEIMGNDYLVRDILSNTYFDKKMVNGEDGSLQRVDRELCSASVPGDTIHIRLTNAAQEKGLNGFETKLLKVVR